jgi:hypothetical protein
MASPYRVDAARDRRLPKGDISIVTQIGCARDAQQMRQAALITGKSIKIKEHIGCNLYLLCASITQALSSTTS